MRFDFTAGHDTMPDRFLGRWVDTRGMPHVIERRSSGRDSIWIALTNLGGHAADGRVMWLADQASIGSPFLPCLAVGWRGAGPARVTTPFGACKRGLSAAGAWADGDCVD